MIQRKSLFHHQKSLGWRGGGKKRFKDTTGCFRPFSPGYRLHPYTLLRELCMSLKDRIDKMLAHVKTPPVWECRVKTPCHRGLEANAPAKGVGSMGADASGACASTGVNGASAAAAAVAVAGTWDVGLEACTAELGLDPKALLSLALARFNVRSRANGLL